MASTSDVRAGGAYVEAYVQQDRLDPQLADVNRKVRASVALAKTSIGGIAQGTVATGRAALAGIALVGMAGAGFARGFVSPSRQATGGIGDIVRAVKSLNPQLRALRSPMDAAFGAIENGGIKGALTVRRMRRLFQSIVPIEEIRGAINKVALAFDGATSNVAEFRTEVRQIPASISSAILPAIAELRSSFQSLPLLAQDTIGRLEHRTLVRGYRRKDGTLVRPHSRSRSQRPGTGTATGTSIVAADAAEQSTALSMLNTRLATTAAEARRAAAAMDAFGAFVGRRAVGVMRFAGELASGALVGGFRSGLSNSTELDAALRAGPGRAVTVFVRQSLPTIIRGGIGATLGFAIGGQFGAAYGAAFATKPIATTRATVATIRRLFGGLRGAFATFSGSRAAAELDQVGASAGLTRTQLERLSPAAVGAASKLGALAGVGARVAGSWIRVGAISAGIVGALSGAAAFNTGSLQAAFTSFKDFNPATAQRTADTLGLTVEQVTRLASAAELSGSSLESVRSAMTHVSGMAREGSDEFAKYGLSMAAVQTASPERRLELVAIALRRINDPAERAAAAVKLLGTNDLGPLMTDFDGLRSRAMMLGGVLGGADVAASLEFKNALAEMHLASKGLGQSLSAAVIPQLTSMVQSTTAVVSAVSGWVGKNRLLIGEIFAVAKEIAIFTSATATAWGVVSRLSFLLPILGSLLPIAPLLIVTGLVVGFAYQCTALGDVARETFASIQRYAQSMVGPVVDAFWEIKQVFTDVFGGILDALSAGDLELASQIVSDGIGLIFARGWDFVHVRFLEFKADFLDGWNNLWTEVRVAGEDLLPGFNSLWTETWYTIFDAITVGWNAVVSGFDIGFAYLTRSINYLRSLWDKSFDLEGANRSIDQRIAQRASDRNNEQDAILAKRDEEKRRHLDDIAKNGLRSTLESENAAANDARRKEIEDARTTDQQALDAAKEKLKLSIERAKREKEVKANAVQSVVSAGASSAKAGAAEASRRGFEASDIRSKEGLAAVAATSRGQSPLDKQLDLAGKSLAEQKKQTDLQFKLWKQQQEGLIPQFPI